MRTVPTLLVCFASTLACRTVSSEISIPDESKGSEPPKTIVEKPPETDFDVNKALDGAERLLAAIDAVADDEGGGDPNAADPGYAMDSWLPDMGLRSLYFYGRSQATLYVLGELFGVPVYASGPHGNDPDLHASSFGHYDLRFVERVILTADALGQDRARVERTREAFERRLRRQAVTYLLVHRAIHRDPAWYAQFEREYLAAIGTEDSTFVRYDDLNPMCEAFENQGFTWYEANTAAYFWVRRAKDGSADAWVRAIEALLAAYGVEVPANPPGLPLGVR